MSIRLVEMNALAKINTDSGFGKYSYEGLLSFTIPKYHGIFSFNTYVIINSEVKLIVSNK